MKMTRFFLIALSVACTQAANAQNNSTPSTTKTTTTMTTTPSATQPVKEFFNAFGSGDFQGIINTFHADCEITAVRAGKRSGNQIYGSYYGKQGVQEFLQNLGAAFDTKAFTIENMVGDGNVAFANGKFTHQLKSTGKLFSSDWTLLCIIADGKIKEYRFFEDSASYVEAATN